MVLTVVQAQTRIICWISESGTKGQLWTEICLSRRTWPGKLFVRVFGSLTPNSLCKTQWQWCSKDDALECGLLRYLLGVPFSLKSVSTGTLDHGAGG